MCEPECPNQAISLGDDIYEIDVERCTECIGHYDEPQCVACCPIDCVEQDPNNIETVDTAAAKLDKLWA
jgi:ferredoxin